MLPKRNIKDNRAGPTGYTNRLRRQFSMRRFRLTEPLALLVMRALQRTPTTVPKAPPAHER